MLRPKQTKHKTQKSKIHNPHLMYSRYVSYTRLSSCLHRLKGHKCIDSTTYLEEIIAYVNPHTLGGVYSIKNSIPIPQVKEKYHMEQIAVVDRDICLFK